MTTTIILTFLSFSICLLGDPINDYKDMFQVLLHDYDLFFREHSSSALDFDVRLSSERKEHLCSFKLNFEGNWQALDLLDSSR